MSIQEVEIPFNKNKQKVLFIVNSACALFGIWLIVIQPKSLNTVFDTPSEMYGGLGTWILFWGVCAYFVGTKLFDSSPGLIISNEGFTDNTTAISAGFVPWKDVSEIQESIIQEQKSICVIVKNPQDYIDRQTNALKRKTLEINYKKLGVIIRIYSLGLKSSYQEVKELLDKRFADYKAKNNS